MSTTIPRHTPHKKKNFDTITKVLQNSDDWPAPIKFFFLPRIQSSYIVPLRLLLWLVLLYFTATIFTNRDQAWIVQNLHSLNLLIHEAGHPIFGILNIPILTSLGGSLMQIIMPLLLTSELWIKHRDLFGASVTLGWTFENLIDISPYIADALVMNLPLISGDTGNEAPYGFHDWNFILSESGLLLHCSEIATAVQTVGLIGLILCLLWGFWSLLYYILFQK